MAPSAGLVAVTVGGDCSRAVVKPHDTEAASAVPSLALTLGSRRAVYVVLSASRAAGVSVAVFVVPSYATVAVTAEPSGAISVNDEAVMLLASILRENVALTFSVCRHAG